MSNPFLQAKRQTQPRKHPSFRSQKYPEIWKMKVEELKTLYEQTTDKHKRGAITRAINEKLGLKIIRATNKQRRARITNYLKFVSAGYLNQLITAHNEFNTLVQNNIDDEAQRIVWCGKDLQVVYKQVKYFIKCIDDTFPPEPDVKRKRVRNKRTWQNVLHVGETK